MNGIELTERLRAGLPVYALGIRASRTTDVVRWAKATGYDTIWIDMKHSTLPVDTVAQLCSCAVDLGLTPWVRVHERDYRTINRVLDGGALGIIIARVETAAQARDVITATRFPPQGQRSQLATLPYVNFETLHARELDQTLNNATAIKVLIESRAGVEAADAIRFMFNLRRPDRQGCLRRRSRKAATSTGFNRRWRKLKPAARLWRITGAVVRPQVRIVCGSFPPRRRCKAIRTPGTRLSTVRCCPLRCPWRSLPAHSIACR
jgi:hypothetical protein